MKEILIGFLVILVLFFVLVFLIEQFRYISNLEESMKEEEINNELEKKGK